MSDRERPGYSYSPLHPLDPTEQLPPAVLTLFLPRYLPSPLTNTNDSPALPQNAIGHDELLLLPTTDTQHASPDAFSYVPLLPLPAFILNHFSITVPLFTRPAASLPFPTSSAATRFPFRLALPPCATQRPSRFSSLHRVDHCAPSPVHTRTDPRFLLHPFHQPDQYVPLDGLRLCTEGRRTVRLSDVAYFSERIPAACWRVVDVSKGRGSAVGA